jgi:hypothetical protein
VEKFSNKSEKTEDSISTEDKPGPSEDKPYQKREMTEEEVEQMKQQRKERREQRLRERLEKKPKKVTFLERICYCVVHLQG